MSKARVHLAFLFSSPLIRVFNQKTENIMQLDYLTEINDILKVCSRMKYEMKYKIDWATTSNTRSMITDGPIALHFSGHGIENKLQNLGSDYILNKDKGNILLLEDEHGMSDYFFEKDLKYMIEMSQWNFEVVFVSSCHSQFAGEVFLNAGAKHVIWIKGGEKISDKASLRFSKVFYETLFVKNYNVCTAYNIAKEEINKVINSTEASKFLLLIQDDTNQKDKIDIYGRNKKRKQAHKCYALTNFREGSLINIDDKPLYDSNPSNVEGFIGRQQEMYEIIDLLDNHRIVCILGPPGIGKTSLARNLANYIKDRKKFSDGIIYVTLRGWESAQMFLTRLTLIVRNSCSLEDYKKHGLEDLDKNGSNNKQKDDKAKDIDQDVEDKYRNFIINMLKEKEVLLIMDNAEDPLEYDNTKFVDELEWIQDHCNNIKFLATTRKIINRLPNKHVRLSPLTKEASLKLLINKAPRDIKNKEILQLLSCNPSKDNQNKTLLNHQFTELLGGHPQAISLAAPLLEYKSLKELYLEFCNSNIMDALEVHEGKPLT